MFTKEANEILKFLIHLSHHAPLALFSRDWDQETLVTVHLGYEQALPELKADRNTGCLQSANSPSK